MASIDFLSNIGLNDTVHFLQNRFDCTALEAGLKYELSRNMHLTLLLPHWSVCSKESVTHVQRGLVSFGGSNPLDIPLLVSS